MIEKVHRNTNVPACPERTGVDVIAKDYGQRRLVEIALSLILQLEQYTGRAIHKAKNHLRANRMVLEHIEKGIWQDESLDSLKESDRERHSAYLWMIHDIRAQTGITA